MFKIVKKEKLAEKINLYEITAPRIAARAQAGQFVIIRINATGERIPLTLADFNSAAGTITLVVQEVGYSTQLLGKLAAGDSILDVAGPLGRPSRIPQNKTAVVVGGGVGIAPIFPIARALQTAGNKVLAVLGARNKSLLFWLDKIQGVSTQVLTATDDGSAGQKGFITDILQEVLQKEKINLVYAIGPGVMMQAVAKIVPQDVELIVSLNALMVDGTGMCGACRVTVGGQTRFTCVDGPEFDGHQVDFAEFLNRHKFYKEEEAHICKIGLQKGIS